MSNRDRQELANIANNLYHNDMSFDESQVLYKAWHRKGNYDQMLTNQDNYAALQELRRVCLKYFTDVRNQLVLDVGAGTGLCGQMLFDNGFRNIHGLEPLPEFANEAEKKEVYSRILVETIGFGNTIDVEDDTYDGVLTCGAFGPGHIPCDALHEFVRIIKPGSDRFCLSLYESDPKSMVKCLHYPSRINPTKRGHAVLGMREEYLWTVPEYKDRLEPLMKQLEADGKWRRVLRERYPNHFLTKDGLMFVFQVC